MKTYRTIQALHDSFKKSYSFHEAEKFLDFPNLFRENLIQFSNNFKQSNH